MVPWRVCWVIEDEWVEALPSEGVVAGLYSIF
jgi:hypothetical protein